MDLPAWVLGDLIRELERKHVIERVSPCEKTKLTAQGTVLLSCQWETTQHRNWQLVLPLSAFLSRFDLYLSLAHTQPINNSLQMTPRSTTKHRQNQHLRPRPLWTPRPRQVRQWFVPSMQLRRWCYARLALLSFPNHSQCLLQSPDAEREQLFDDGSSDVHTPRKKSTQEILTKYKFKGVISSPQHSFASITGLCLWLNSSVARRRTPPPPRRTPNRSSWSGRRNSR